MEKEVKGVANRRREGDRFKRMLEALCYGAAAERFRYASEKEEEQINRNNEWGG
jgi:hypothetical protein